MTNAAPHADRLHAELLEGARVEQARHADAVELGQPVGGEQAAGQRAPDAGQAVRGERADRVVELLLDRQDGEDDQDAGHEADDRGRPELHVAGRGGDADEARDRAVAGHADVERAGLEVRHQAGADDAGRRAELRDEHDLGEARAARAERRAAVEAEPAEPQDQHAEADERHRVARDRPRLAVGAVLAAARAEQQQARERARGADQVDDRRAGEVLHAAADLAQEAAAEDPVRAERVDDRREHDGVDHVRDELDALQRRAPDDRQGDGAEHELEQHERGRASRVTSPSTRPPLIVEPVEKKKPESPSSAPAPPKASAKPQAHHAIVGDREVDEDLRDPHAGVLAAREADLQEREAGLHEHHEHGRDHDPRSR